MTRVPDFSCDQGSGVLRPAASPNIHDLALALARLGGVRDVPLSGAAASLLADFGEARRYVFVLLDGLGDHLLTSLRPAGFLGTHRRRILDAVRPTGTTASLTTMTTGLWPGEHGLLSWWTHISEAGITAAVPPMVDRGSHKELRDPETYSALFSVESLAGRFSRRVAAYFPRPLADRPFACFLSGGRPALPYDGLRELLATLLTPSCSAPSLSYVYVPDLDKTVHRSGSSSRETSHVLTVLDETLEAVASNLDPELRLIVTADHGLVDVDDDESCDIMADDPMLSLLEGLPSGERRFLIFRTRPGNRARFADTFQDRFGGTNYLFPSDLVAQSGLIGPRVTPLARGRLGDFVAVPRNRGVLRIAGDRPQAASHGGFTTEETRVPLIVA